VGVPMVTTEKLIAEAERIAARTKRQIRSYRSRLAHVETDAIGTGDLRARAERAERELKRIYLYRAFLASRPTAQALMPEYVLARWSRRWRAPVDLRD
jgi:hypothetical protein